VETQLIVLRAIGGNYKGMAPTRSQFKDLARSLRSKLRVTVIATGEGCKQVLRRGRAADQAGCGGADR